MGAPDTVIPGSVPGELLLVRTDDVAVAVAASARTRTGLSSLFTRGCAGVDTEIGPSGDPFSWHRRFRGAYAPDDVLRFGLMYADGRRVATNTRHIPRSASSEDGEIVLNQEGGGGSAGAWDQGFWVHPLPPDGPVTLVASWLEHGVTEERADLDGAEIRAAAARAVSLWPDEPDTEAT